MLLTKILFRAQYTLTEDREKNIACKWKQKECWGTNILIRQGRLKKKSKQKTKKVIVHDKRSNTRMEYNIHKHRHLI